MEFQPVRKCESIKLGEILYRNRTLKKKILLYYRDIVVEKIQDIGAVELFIAHFLEKNLFSLSSHSNQLYFQ